MQGVREGEPNGKTIRGIFYNILHRNTILRVLLQSASSFRE